jgi:hypothetical protein
MKNLTVDGGSPPPTLMGLVEEVFKSGTPEEALALAMQWLYAKKLQGNPLQDKINKWKQHWGPVTQQKVLNFVRDHEMDAEIVSRLAIPVVTRCKVDI